MVSADAKCKVSIGEPGTPIAAVTRGKRVMVGMNESFQITDHDFSKISLIPDGTLIQDVPSPDEDDKSGAIKTVKFSTPSKTWHSKEALHGGGLWSSANPSETITRKEYLKDCIYIC